MSINVISTPKLQIGAGPRVYAGGVDARGLERALRDRVDGEVRFDASRRALYESMLAPRVREADPRALVVADGFSCRQQVAHLTGLGALHAAQVLQMPLHGPAAPAGRSPSTPTSRSASGIPDPAGATWPWPPALWAGSFP